MPIEPINLQPYKITNGALDYPVKHNAAMDGQQNKINEMVGAVNDAVETVSNNIMDINVVAGIAPAVTEVAAASEGIQIVVDNIAAVEEVSSNMAAVQLTADNMAAVQAAPAAAEQAVTSAEEAEASAVEAAAIPILNLAGAGTDVTGVMVKHYNRFTFAGEKTLNIKTDVEENIPARSQIHMRVIGAGDLTIAPAAGVAVNIPAGGTLVMQQGMYATLIKVGADEYDLLGYVVPA